MKKIHRILFLIILVHCYSYIGAQDDFPNLQALGKIPVPPSPNASALGKFGEIPVGLSTGIPSISIPFYQYSDKSKGMSMGVGLSYHAGGHKLEDMPSNVGLGWALNAGGVISRTMRGLPDEHTNGYLNTPVNPNLFTGRMENSFINPLNNSFSNSLGITLENTFNFHDVRNIAENKMDGEADIFHFNISGYSGKFFFRKTGEIQLMSQSNLRINYEHNNYIISSFTITDDHGISYIFNNLEWTSVYDPFRDLFNTIQINHVSSWYLGKIISADGKDTIKLNYDYGGELNYEGSFCESYQSAYQGQQSTVTTKHTYQALFIASSKISSIDFPDGTSVQFEYDLSRLDYSGDKALTAVFVRSPGAEKKFILSYDYFESPYCYANTGCVPGLTYSAHDYYKRLKLLSVQESDGANQLPPFEFEYNQTPLKNRNSKASDWWGYYNGIGDKESPEGIPGGYPSFGPNRNSSQDASKAWLLEKIIYPTGGYTRFYFEGNDAFFESSHQVVGGQRVFKTEDFDPASGNFITTKYSYKKADNNSSGTMAVKPSYSYYWTYSSRWDGSTTIPYYFPNDKLYLNQSSNPSQSLTSFNGSPVIYTRVKMEKVVNGVNNGYTIYEFTPAAKNIVYEDYSPFVQQQDYDWVQGLPIKENYFNSDDVNVKEVEFEYSHHSVFPNVLSDSNCRNLTASLVHWDNLNTLSNELYGARSYVLMYGHSFLIKTTEKSLGQAGEYIQNVTEYSYDPQHFLPTKATTWNSKGNKIETKFYYPFNYSVSGLPLRESFMEANRVGEIISTEVWEQFGSTPHLKSASVTEYQTMLKPSKIVAIETTAPIDVNVVGVFDPDQLKRHTVFKDQVEYTSYDVRGRPLEVKSQGETYMTLIWGENNSYPIAMVNNAAAPQVAYTSFESSYFGNWELDQNFSIGLGGITGKKSGNGSLTATVPNGTYIVSLWAQGSVSVNGVASSTALKQRGPWNYYEWVLTNPGNVIVQGSSIDEVRLYPKEAQMATYTIDALLGMTSQCDLNNNITYYEYDGFGRLHLVKDDKLKILKKICYNYQNQIENCSGIYNTPVWQPTGQVQCKPCGSTTYYSSNLQERLELDVNSNSPTYNTYRWVDAGTSSQCVALPAWTAILPLECETSNSAPTGYQTGYEKDLNPCSPTFNTIRPYYNLNLDACPLSSGCTDCTGDAYACIYSQCEQGIKVYTDSYQDEWGMWHCTFHYEWSNGSWSQNYVEQNVGSCPIM